MTTTTPTIPTPTHTASLTSLITHHHALTTTISALSREYALVHSQLMQAEVEGWERAGTESTAVSYRDRVAQANSLIHRQELETIKGELAAYKYELDHINMVLSFHGYGYLPSDSPPGS